MSDQIPWDLLDQYLAGDTTPAEQAEAQTYLASHPSEKAVLQRVTARVTQPPHDIIDVHTWWLAMQRRMDESGYLRQPIGWRRHMAQQTVATIAAAAVVIIGLAVVLGHQTHTTVGAQTTYTTANGQRATITLTDGSVVTLNVGSRIDIPQTFGNASRTVHLYGEADFRVAHVSGTPFIVESNGVRTTVLGTEFSVRAYKTQAVQVVVRTGKVSVAGTVLDAHDVASIAAGRITIARHQDVDAALGFTTGYLVLKDVKLRDATEDLNRWYDADIRLGDPSLGVLPIDAVLVSGSIGDCMELLKNVFDVRVVRNGRILTLYPR